MVDWIAAFEQVRYLNPTAAAAALRERSSDGELRGRLQGLRANNMLVKSLFSQGWRDIFSHGSHSVGPVDNFIQEKSDLSGLKVITFKENVI